MSSVQIWCLKLHTVVILVVYEIVKCICGVMMLITLYNSIPIQCCLFEDLAIAILGFVFISYYLEMLHLYIALLFHQVFYRKPFRFLWISFSQIFLYPGLEIICIVEQQPINN